MLLQQALLLTLSNVIFVQFSHCAEVHTKPNKWFKAICSPPRMKTHLISIQSATYYRGGRPMNARTFVDKECMYKPRCAIRVVPENFGMKASYHRSRKSICYLPSKCGLKITYTCFDLPDKVMAPSNEQIKCEGKQLKLDCHKGFVIIIRYGRWGHLAPHDETCDKEGAGHKIIRNRYVTKELISYCNERQACELTVSRTIFGLTEPKIKFKLQYAFECLKTGQPQGECRSTRSGSDYCGNLSVTRTGKTCIWWNSVHAARHLPFADGSLTAAKNYCRNPTPHGTSPWCYVSQYHVEECNVKFCRKGCKATASGDTYFGVWHYTQSGRPCQKWSLNRPHIVPRRLRSILLQSENATETNNHCRNPDGRRGPWCFTIDANVEWEYCEIPLCSVEPYPEFRNLNPKYNKKMQKEELEDSIDGDKNEVSVLPPPRCPTTPFAIRDTIHYDCFKLHKEYVCASRTIMDDFVEMQGAWSPCEIEGTTQVMRCDDSKLVIACPREHRIAILEATYGHRKNDEDCEPRATEWFYEKASPKLSHGIYIATSNLQRTCEGMSHCELFVGPTNEITGGRNPASNANNKLEITYKCLNVKKRHIGGCTFPFKYGNRWHWQCIENARGEGYWCSTYENYDQTIQSIPCNDFILSTRGAKRITKNCYEQYKYEGKMTSGCTKQKKSGYTWCSLTENYDADKEWKWC